MSRFIVAISINLIFIISVGKSLCETIHFFRLKRCFFEFHSINSSSSKFFRIPIEYVDVSFHNDYTTFRCNITDSRYRSRPIFPTIIDFNSFLCHNRDLPKNLKLLKSFFDVIYLYRGITSRDIIYNVISNVLRTLATIKPYSDFQLLLIDMIIDLCYSHKMMQVMLKDDFAVSLFRATQSSRSLNNSILHAKTSYFRYMNYETFITSPNKLTYQVIDQSVYVKVNKIKPNINYGILTTTRNADFVYLVVEGEEDSFSIQNEFFIRKPTINSVIKCEVWNENGDKSSCISSETSITWSKCYCDKLGIINVKFVEKSIYRRHFDDTTISKFVEQLKPVVKFISYEEVEILEDIYRSGRLSDRLNKIVAIICGISVLIIILFLILSRSKWNQFSQTNRTYVCLLLLLWLNILLIQPLLINVLRKYRHQKETNSEYLVWGMIVVHAVSMFSLMLGGAQVMLFICSVNISWVTKRGFDSFLTLIVVMCCCISFIIVLTSFPTIVLSIDRKTLLPFSYGSSYFILVPLMITLFVSLVLSGVAFYLPNKGGGTFIMIIIYPLILLQFVNFYQVMTMKDVFNINYIKYMYYTFGVFLQALYLFMGVIMILVLPLKNLTVFGRRDMVLRLEYIYLIKFKNKSGHVFL